MDAEIIGVNKKFVWLRIPERFGRKILTIPRDVLPSVEKGDVRKVDVFGELMSNQKGWTAKVFPTE